MHFPRAGRAVRGVCAAAAGLLMLAACESGRPADPAPDPSRSHHAPGGGFRNPAGSPTWQPETFDFVRFMVRRFEVDESPELILPADFVVPRDIAKGALAASGDNPRITWIGHATFLVGIEGVNILTDPFFSERASPVGFAGPKRFVPPGLEIEDLPPIDAIVISHNHYDHFDLNSLERIAETNPAARVFVPLGLGPLAEKAGFADVRELDWFHSAQVGPVTITATPAIHRSNRGLFDVNETLWASYAIQGKSFGLWFAGDTGFGPVFEREVAPRIGRIDVALVPVGAFLPRQVMRAVHTTPEEGVELARVVGAETAVAMHWGTLPLGHDLPAEAMERFTAHRVAGVENLIMRIGETRSFSPAQNLANRVP